MRDLPEILGGVQAAVAKTLCLDLDEVQTGQRFFPDLGAESIDWLELSFLLEKKYGKRLPGLGNYAGIETDAEGRLTPGGIAAMRAFMPASLLDRIQSRDPLPTSKELVEEITVTDIAYMVQMAVEANAERLSA
jgi:acyl carrier protein